MDKMFEKYQKRMTKIGIFKSIIFSLIISFSVIGVIAIITLFAKASILLTLSITIGGGVAAFIISAFLLYFKRFRPNAKMIAQKLDALGMDERYITMIECGENNSTMARLQREDAKQKLHGISSKSLKFTLAVPVIVLLVLCFAFAAGTTTLSSLSAANVIGTKKAPPEIITPAPKEYFTIKYLVYDGGGTVEGKTLQTVESGKNTEPVLAVAEKDFRFVAWVDENKNYLANKNNPRVELNVHENMTIYALFEKKSAQNPDDGVDGELGKGEGDQKPEGGDGEDGDGGGSQGQVGEGGGSSGGSSAGRENNNVIDGSQDYKENFDREKFENELNDKDIPDELKDILGDYYNTIKP